MEHGIMPPELAQRQQQIHTLRAEIDGLLDEDNNGVFMLDDVNWLQLIDTGVVLPDFLLPSSDNLILRETDSVMGRFVYKLDPRHQDYVRINQQWDNYDKVELTEEQLLLFLQSAYDGQDGENIPLEKLQRSRNNYLITGSVVWLMHFNPEVELWSVKDIPNPYGGHRIRAMYAGYLQRRLQSFEER